MSEDLKNSLYDLEIIKTLSEKESTLLYLVKNIKTQQEFVAKIYKNQLKTVEEKKLFIKEIISYSKIRSPGVSLLSSFSLRNDNNCFPIVLTKYREGGSLDEILEKQYSGIKIPAFTQKRKYTILISIVLAMETLHSLQIYHNNLKPSNIVLDKDLTPHIINPFFSSFSNAIQNSDFFYTAPEIVLNQPFSNKSDIYSFSLLLYEFVTNKRPYEKSDTYEQFLNDLKNFKRPELSFVRDLRIRNFIKRCWSSNPTQRPSFEDILTEVTDESYLRAFNVTKREVTDYIISYKIQEEEFIYEDEDAKITNSNINSKFVIKHGKERDMMSTKIAADNGEAEAMFDYALRLQKGDGVPKDRKLAAQYYKMSADKGYVLAMFNYAILYYNGDGVEVDKKKAAQYFKKAADAGETTAMINYAYMLHTGVGVQPDSKKCARYYKMAADRGQVKGMLNYAILLQNGEGVQPNLHEAARYFKMAANEGEVTSMLNYGIMLRDGKGIEQNKTKALKYLKMAANKGSVRAMTEYGIALQRGDCGVCNKEEAFYYFKKAAEKNDSIALFNLGIVYEHGEGCKVDLKEAERCYKTAADNGNSNAMFNYGLLHYENENESFVNKDLAIQYFEKAAELENPYAYFQLGIMMLEGRDLEVDVEKGLKYVKMAVDMNHLQAMYRYALMLYNGEYVEQNKVKAASYYKAAADRGEVNSMLNYGLMLLNGDGIPQNKKEAEHYFQLAKEIGNITIALEEEE